MRSAESTSTESPISNFRHATGLTRTITGVILFFFLWMNVEVAAAAAKDVIEGKAAPASRSAPAQATPANADPQRETMQALHSTLKDMDVKLTKYRDRVVKKKDKKGNLHITIIGTPDDVDLTQNRKQLDQLRQQLAAQDQEAEAGFAKDLEHIKAHKLPKVIEERHAAALAKYRSERDATNKSLDDLARSKDLTSLITGTEQLLSRVQGYLPKHAKFDPKNLPFRTADPKVRKPITDPIQLKKLFSGKQKIAATVLPVEARKQEITPTELAQIEKASSEGETYKTGDPVEVASNGSMAGLLATSIVMPGPEYLAPTEDVQITPAIQALATELHNNPVEIYNWVHNNIEFIPSYGSIQGSQLTLDKKVGNAFDTASLLIALLRASNIPARYAYGTIQLSIVQAMNWAGGFTNADAAQTFLSSGGIPNVGLTKGGTTFALRMEHVWVEAFVDFEPSRGAKNLTPDAWVPMDASFKQYTYTDGLDLQGQVPFDSQGFLSAAQQGATVNEQDGYVQNLNQANIQSRLTQYQQQLQSFIENQNPDATVGQVLGAKTINSINAPVLAASLPYQLVATGNRYANLPDGLRHKFRYSLYLDEQQRALESSIFSYETATTSLAGKKLTLAYVPSSDNDRQTVESYLPKPHEDGSPIQPEEFPSSLPAYNIHVTPELRVEGQVVARGGSFTLGTELLGEGGFTNLQNLATWDLTDDLNVAGQTGALGISLQGISAHQLTTLKDRLADTKARLEASNFENLTGEHLSGDLLTATVWSYFVSIEFFGRIAQRQADIADNPGLSYGFFYAITVPIKTYGVARRVNFPGVLMDIGHQRRVAFAKNNDTQAWINYNRVRGQHSSVMEHAIPERFFDDPNDSVTPEGVSAVTAIAVAATQGQKIYTLTQANQAQLANIQHSGAVMDNIRAAIAAGKEVTIHESRISQAGFNGAGYVISDPQTGAGAYLIEGGANGGKLQLTASGQLQAMSVGLVLVGGLGVAVAGILAGAPIIFALISLLIVAITIAILEAQYGAGFDGIIFGLVRFIGAVVAVGLGIPGAGIFYLTTYLAFLGAIFLDIIKDAGDSLE